MIEPMAVAVHSVSNIGQLKTNEVIVVMGAGTLSPFWAGGHGQLDGGR
jgi:threonine dehydrogenase-like Zn-dependent dehydrogenase